MSIVHISVQISDVYAEVMWDDVEQTELTIESVVAAALLELGDFVHVKKVTVVTPQRAVVEVPEKVPEH